MEFTTRRLIVKKFIPEYIPIMFETWGKDIEVGRYLPGFKKDFDMDSFTYFILGTLKDEYNDKSVIKLKEDNTVIGYLSLYQEDSRSKSVNLVIMKDYWDHGYGKEVMKQVVNLLKKDGLGSLYATCDSNNLRTQKVLEESGFELIDEIEGDRKDIDGNIGDELLYEVEMIRVKYNE